MAPKPPPGHFILLYFASASSFTGKTAEIFQAPINLKDLFDFLEAKYSGIKDRVLDSCAVTVNLHYVDIVDDDEGSQEPPHRIISEGDEVGIIPPVSSG